MNDMDLAKQESIKQFIQRKKNAPVKIDNSKLVAGSRMYFYCRHCDNISDVLPEDYLCRPRHVCSQCEDLVEYGWIEEAKNGIGKNQFLFLLQDRFARIGCFFQKK